MIIRTQDRKKLFIMENADSIEVNEYSKIKNSKSYESIYEVNIDNGLCETLGEYSSEEKALKVLDDIQQKYLSHLVVEGGPLATIDAYVQPNVFNIPKVFEMPEDDEVNL